MKKQSIDLMINDSKYEFLLLHSDITEDINDHRPFGLLFQKQDNCYISEELDFVPTSNRHFEKLKHLRAPFVYYLKNSNRVMINYVDRVLQESLIVSNIGLYIKDGSDYLQSNENDKNEVNDYYKNSDNELFIDII